MRRANVQEMLERIADKEGLWYSPFSVTVEYLAPKVEAALRASAREMQLIYEIDWEDKYQTEEVERCVLAGIKKLGETI